MSDQALDLAGLRELADKLLTEPRDALEPGQWYVRSFAQTLSPQERLVAAVPALLDEVERLAGERDRARDAAVALEQENAEALRIAREALDGVGGSNALARFEMAFGCRRGAV